MSDGYKGPDFLEIALAVALGILIASDDGAFDGMKAESATPVVETQVASQPVVRLPAPGGPR
ncbi:MAG: hypothetical protein KKA05_07805 [Alphaproteobacteria bacterium]|nr:hypothetical protein [Alphaproteobacteria bacterium]